MKCFRIFGSLVLGLCLTTGFPVADAAQQITLLHIGDTHSHVVAWGPKDGSLDGTLGGLPKAAAIVAAEKASDAQALFVHAGDFMGGDLFFSEYLGVAELLLLESIGLDALVLGNHEFQFGPDFLVGVLSAAWPAGGGVPILGTNIDPWGHAVGGWITPTLIKDVNGVKVGLFGLTTPTGALAIPDPVKILPYLDEVAPAAVANLRDAGVQVVVCVSHLGMASARELAEAVSGIDVIVNAHDHAVLDQPETIARPGGGTTFIVSAGSYYRWVGRLRLSVDGDDVSLADYVLFGADAAALPLSAVQAAVDSLGEGIVARYGDVYHLPLAWADQPIGAGFDPRHAKRDTPLGNLFTDAYRARTSTEIALEGTGFLGDTLPEGVIVGADVFRSMSYGIPKSVGGQMIVRPYRLATFRTTGAALLGALEYTLWVGGDYFPQFSGLRLDYDSSAPPFHKIVRDTVKVGGHKLLSTQLYSVTVTEGVLSVLGSLLPMQDVLKLPDLAFDAAREFVTMRGVLGPASSNRIRDIAAIPGKSK